MGTLGHLDNPAGSDGGVGASLLFIYPPKLVVLPMAYYFLYYYD